ncbi:macrophage mannose receptor 1-like [Anguilla rostrata]|uniref:macrophage mannose receptor 1-like n=1 Tax=Anguilla rostrata TaxID=7938 RepID=UPI0030CF9378
MSEVFYSSMKFKKNFRQRTAATQDDDVTYSEVKTINPTASNTVCHCGSAEHSGQSSYPYRRVAVSLGLLCALLLAATVVLCVLYTSLSENYSMLERDLEELRSNYSTMYTEKVQLQSTLCKPCLQGWAQFSSKCYYFSNETKSWEDSRSDCEEWGADLVIIESEEEKRFINNKTQSYTWTGLSYSAAKGNWLWVNGTPLQKGFWESREPDVQNGNVCVMFSPHINAWGAYYCSDVHNFICETNALLPYAPHTVTGGRPVGSSTTASAETPLFVAVLSLQFTVSGATLLSICRKAFTFTLLHMKRSFLESAACSFCTGRVCEPCPQGWAQFSSKCYYFSNERKNWTDSRSDCEERGADLVIIESEEEQWFIYEQIKSTTWIGLRYSAAMGNWLWVDGTPLQEGFWGSGEPGDEKGFYCALIASIMNAWLTIYCDYDFNFVCETNALLPLSEMAALVSKDSEGIYTALACPDQDVYNTLGQTSLNSPGAQHKGHSGQSSLPYRRATVILGLLCALLLAATVVLCVLYTSLLETYSKEKELRSNCSTMNTEKVQLQSTLCKPCPQGWAQFSSKCYYFSNETKSWADSRSDCKEWGADLVITESEEEQRFINKQIKDFTWIGLRYSAARGNWLWVNGTPLQKGFGGSREPDVKNGCVLFAPQINALGVYHCSDVHNFICETNALPP